MQFFASLILIVAFFGASQTQPQMMDVCWREMYGRGAGTIPKFCPAGSELNGLLCYPLCQTGFYGVGPVCWETCKAGYTDYGVFCGHGGSTYVKKSYGRTAGFVPGCPNPEVEDAGLCYQTCVGTFVGEGPVCWNSVGNATHTVKCSNLISFGHTEGDCEILNGYLKKGGITSYQCLVALITSIEAGKVVAPIQCIEVVKDIFPTLYHLPFC